MQRYEMKSIAHPRTATVSVMVLLSLLPSVSFGQIDHAVGNAHDGDPTYGLNILSSLSSYQNNEDISLLVEGAITPLVYPDPGFRLYGLYAMNVLDLINTATIDANGVGGVGSASSGIYGYGMYSFHDANNTGDVTLSLTGGTTTATDANVAPEVKGFGVYSTTGSITNTGDVEVATIGETAETNNGTVNADTAAFGLFAYSISTAITNSGTLTISATASEATAAGTDNTAQANASTVGIASGNTVDNTGTINASATAGTASAQGDAEAITQVTAIQGQGAINNKGYLDVEATGGNAHSSEGEAYAGALVFGIGTGGPGDVNNVGTISISARGGTAESDDDADATISAVGIFSDNNDPNVSNTGAISITAIGGNVIGDDDASAFVEAGGIFGPGNITNTGTIFVNSIGGTAANSTTMDLNVGVGAAAITSEDNSITNSGVLIVSATGGQVETSGEADADAMGIGIFAYKDVVNLSDGDIYVTIRGGSVNGVSDTSARAEAYGIRSNRSLVNAGAIDVNAVGGTATSTEGVVDADAYAYGLSTEAGTINNSGNVTATALAKTGSTSHAYGIYMVEGGTLTNTGILRASGDDAYELYVDTGTTTLANTYNVTLDGDPNDASIFVADNATLALNDATLTVTDVTGETQWDTPYQLFETDPNGTVTGHFANADAVNPDATAVYYTQGTGNAADDTVALTYSPEASEAAGSATVTKQILYQASDIVNRRMTGVLLQNILSPTPSTLLADAGSTAESMALTQSAPTKKPAGVFFEPYYSRLNQDANPLGYKARLWGFAAGYEQAVENTLLGLHAGYGQSDIDYTGVGYNANREDQDVLTVGFSGLTRWDPWTLRYGITGFYGWHDYAGRTGLNNDERETASFNSHGAAAQVMAGRAFRRDQHVFLPEVGLSYLWSHRNSYTTEATDPSWNATFSDLDDHDVQAEAALRWLGCFLHDAFQIVPSVSIGMRHLLTDNETSVSMSVPGAAPVLVRSERDRTALTLSGSMTLTKARHALSVAYDGEYANDSQRHSVWMRYGWRF